MRRPIAATIAVVGFFAGATIASVSADAPVAYDEYQGSTKVRDWRILPGTNCLTAGTNRRMAPDGQPLSVCTPTTTTAPSTTRPTTTSSSTTSTTRPPTTTAAPSTTLPPSGGSFVATFTDSSDLDRFRYGVFHRDNVMVAQTEWPADHSNMGGDHHCGNPASTSRTVHRSSAAESIYVCETIEGNADASGHLMTSMGDTSGYSIVWFSPKQTFDGQTFVSWDASVTFLGNRKWWEVAIVPVSAPDLSCMEGLPCGFPGGYPDDSVIVNYDGVFVDNVQTDPWGFANYCWGPWTMDATGCASKSIRRHFEVRDNGNGTITITWPPEINAAPNGANVVNGQTTVAGAFPDGPFKVVFKDHNYTPTKDGPVAGFSWHYDNVTVR